jgi:hypothetical protein
VVERVRKFAVHFLLTPLSITGIFKLLKFMAVGSSLDNNPNKSVVLTEEKVDEIEGKSEHI